MQKYFSFRGIVRNTDNLLAHEGECMELVNMRVNNGSLQPVAPPEIVAKFDYSYSAIYIHSLASVYICVTTDEGRIHLYDSKFKPLSTALMVDGAPLLSPEAIGVKRVEFMGNIVCMYTQEKSLYAIYDAGEYKWLGESPKIPKLIFSTKSIVHEVTTDQAYDYPSLNDSVNPETRWDNCSKGYFDECVSKLNSNGYFVDRALFRYAFRLFDGSYICASPIYYLEDKNEVYGLCRDRGNFYSQRADGSAGTTAVGRYTVRVQGFKPEFLFTELELEPWENIIVSIDIFTSGSILGHKIINSSEVYTSRNENVYHSSSVGYERYVFKPYSELWREVAECSLFYKIAEFKLDGSVQDYETDVSPMVLAHCDTLPIESGSHNKITADYSYVFNGRLHLASLREKYFEGYRGDCFLPVSLGNISVYSTVYTELKTSAGTVIVKKVHQGDFLLGVSSGGYYITPLLVYPDARARKMTFVIRLNSTYYKKSFPLTQHKALNVSYYLHSKVANLDVSVNIAGSSATSVRILSLDNVLSFFNYTVGEYTLVYSDSGEWLYGDKCFAAPNDSTLSSSFPTILWNGEVKAGDVTIVKVVKTRSDDAIGALSDIPVDATWEQSASEPIINEVNTCDVRENVMRVSAVDNPFMFPVAQTYKPSNGAIRAICSNTVTLSQGQFGQHPLYLFCSDGIWALSVDTSGSSAYAGCYPLSREVCNNPLSVKGIDSGVVFNSEKGLMLMQGGSISNLSQPIMSESDDVESATLFNIFSRISEIASLDSMLVNDKFRIYAKDASIGYNYKRSEIVVTNKKYPYSYVCSLAYGEWYKISHTFDFISNSYPNLSCLAVKDGKSIFYTFNDEGVTETSVLLISRPLLWGGKFYKRVLQFMLHAVIKPATGSNLFNGLACYLLCSNDGVNFKLVTGSEIREECNDVHFPYMVTYSYRYFAIAIVGNVSSNSRITAVEMFIDSAWNNRIR